jgi:hypothetical protein
VLIWVHDNIERNDAAVYLPDDYLSNDAPPIERLCFADLPPDWSEIGAREPGTMRWSINWVGGLAGSPDPNPDLAIRNDKVSIGMTMLEPGHAVPAETRSVSRLYLVVQGEAITNIGNLGRLDGLHLAPGETAKIRNNGPAPLQLLWVDSPAG